MLDKDEAVDCEAHSVGKKILDTDHPSMFCHTVDLFTKYRKV